MTDIISIVIYACMFCTWMGWYECCVFVLLLPNTVLHAYVKTLFSYIKIAVAVYYVLLLINIYCGYTLDLPRIDAAVLSNPQSIF